MHMKKYKLARVQDCKGDITKQWYVVYYVFNSDIGELERKRDYTLNRLKTKKDRKAEGDRLVKLYNELLISGKIVSYDTPTENDLAPVSKVKEQLTLLQASKDAVKIKSTGLSENTVRYYKLLLNNLEDFLETDGSLLIDLEAVDSKFMHRFFDYLKLRGLANSTHNVLLGYMRAIFNLYIDREILTKNPTKNIRLLPVESNNHKPYHQEELETIKNYGDQGLLRAIKFIYFAATRPSELVQLRIGDIHERTIFIPASVRKTKKGQHITIPRGLEELIQEMGYRNYPKDYYIFSHNFRPGTKRLHISKLRRRSRNMLKAIGLFDGIHTLYAHKHTGAIRLFESTKDVLVVQKQLGHSTSKQTETYLRDMGKIINEEVLDFAGF